MVTTTCTIMETFNDIHSQGMLHLQIWDEGNWRCTLFKTLNDIHRFSVSILLPHAVIWS